MSSEITTKEVVQSLYNHGFYKGEASLPIRVAAIAGLSLTVGGILLVAGGTLVGALNFSAIPLEEGFFTESFSCLLIGSIASATGHVLVYVVIKVQRRRMEWSSVQPITHGGDIETSRKHFQSARMHDQVELLQRLDEGELSHKCSQYDASPTQPHVTILELLPDRQEVLGENRYRFSFFFDKDAKFDMYTSYGRRRQEIFIAKSGKQNIVEQLWECRLGCNYMLRSFKSSLEKIEDEEVMYQALEVTFEVALGEHL